MCINVNASWGKAQSVTDLDGGRERLDEIDHGLLLDDALQIGLPRLSVLREAVIRYVNPDL